MFGWQVASLSFADVAYLRAECLASDGANAFVTMRLTQASILVGGLVLVGVGTLISSASIADRLHYVLTIVLVFGMTTSWRLAYTMVAQVHHATRTRTRTRHTSYMHMHMHVVHVYACACACVHVAYVDVACACMSPRRARWPPHHVSPRRARWPPPRTPPLSCDDTLAHRPPLTVSPWHTSRVCAGAGERPRHPCGRRARVERARPRARLRDALLLVRRVVGASE
jgi:hypothetical protein